MQEIKSQTIKVGKHVQIQEYRNVTWELNLIFYEIKKWFICLKVWVHC